MSQDKPNNSEEAGKKSGETTPNRPEGEQKESDAIHREPTRPMAPTGASDTEEVAPEIDEGPRPGPVDEIQEALFEAAQADLSTDVEFDELVKPEPELDEGPRPGPVDDVQEAIFSAAQEGATTEVDFDTLPEPSPEITKKVISFERKETVPAPQPEASPSPASAPESPLDELSPPQPGPAPPVEVVSDANPTPSIFDFWGMLALFVTFRLFTLFLLRPGGFIRDWSDFDTYFGIASLSDYSLYPFLNFWLEWPPLVPWLAVGAYKLALLLPPWPDDARLWFILILGSSFVLFEIGNFILIYRLARRLWQDPATVSRTLWIYIGLFPPVYAMLGFFDGVALFFILLALELLLNDQRFPSAIAVGVGFMVKIIPVVMLPVALRRIWYRHQDNNQEAGIEAGLYGVVFGLSILALLAPFLLLGPEWVLASARSMLGRSSWETVWAIAEGYYGFGQVAGDRLNPAETSFAIHSGWSAAVWWLITLIFAGIYGYIFTRPANYDQPRNLVAFGGLTVAIFMLYSKGYSPQFLVYLLPFILLLLPDGRGLTYMLTLTGLNVLEQPVYFVLIPGATWLLAFIVIVRFLITIALVIEFALVLWSAQAQLAIFARVHRYVPVGLGGFAALALIVLTPLTLRAYTTEQLSNSPLGTFAGFMETQHDSSQAVAPRLLLSDQATYRQVYPHLSTEFDLHLTDGASRTFTEAATIQDLLSGLEQVWILPTGPQAQVLRGAVSARGTELAAYDFDGLGTASLYSLQPNASRFIAPARFSGGLELLSHQMTRQGNTITLTLYWRALNTQAQSLTVFTQIINADGQRIEGHDSIPANGTAPMPTWTVGAVVADPHRIPLPPDLSPGEYTLVAGLYNDFNERLSSIDPDGVTYLNRAVPLEAIQLP